MIWLEERERTHEHTLCVRHIQRQRGKKKKAKKEQTMKINRKKICIRTKIEPKPKIIYVSLLRHTPPFYAHWECLFLFSLLFRLEKYTGAYTHHRKIGAKLFAIWDVLRTINFLNKKKNANTHFIWVDFDLRPLISLGCFLFFFWLIWLVLLSFVFFLDSICFVFLFLIFPFLCFH